MMSIVIGPKRPFYSCILILMLLGQVMYKLCTKGRAPRTKETLPDFRERCRVTRHSRVFPRVDGYSTDPRDLGRHNLVSEPRYTNT